jgi:hypothetical protein
MLNIKRNRQLGQETTQRKENIQYYYRVAALWYEAKAQAIKLLDWKQLWSEAKEEGELDQFLIAPGVRNISQDPYSDNEYDRRGYTPREYDMDAYYQWQHQRLLEMFSSGVGDIQMIDKTNPDIKQLQAIHRRLRKYIVDQLDILLTEPEYQQVIADLNSKIDAEEIQLFNDLREMNNLTPEDKNYLTEIEVKIAHALSELLITLNKKRMNERSEKQREYNAGNTEEFVPIEHAETLMGREYHDSLDNVIAVVGSQANTDLNVTVTPVMVKNVQDKGKGRKQKKEAEAKAWLEANKWDTGEIEGVKITGSRSNINITDIPDDEVPF